MNIEKFKELFLAKKWKEAGMALEEFLASEISPKEQGEALVALATLHMQVENTLNKEYLTVLDNAILELSRLNQNYRSLSHALDLAEARKQIDS